MHVDMIHHPFVAEVRDVVVRAVTDPEHRIELQLAGDADVGRDITLPAVAGLPESRLDQQWEHPFRTTAWHVRKLHAGAPVIQVDLPLVDVEPAHRTGDLRRRPLEVSEEGELRRELI